MPSSSSLKLKAAGVIINPGRGKGGHVQAIHGDRVTVVPVHGAKDLDPALCKMICKQLGLAWEAIR